ncbi:MAG: DUF5916 domain-containing protein [bacterium]
MNRIRLIRALAASCALAGGAFASAVASEPDAAATRGPSARRAEAIRLEGTRPRLDGVLDDAEWSGARFTSEFTQKDPEEGKPARNRTEIAFLYDEAALYVGARMKCEEPGRIISTVSRRDDGGNSERVIVSLDTYRDRRTAYTFAVTASGVRIDYYHPNDHENDRDYSFDPVWEAKAARDEHGWTAEMRIPFSQLRFTSGEQQVWGVNVNRWSPRMNEDSYWVMVPKEETGWSSRMGELSGIEGVAPSRRVELFPYAASGATFAGEADASDPFADDSEFTGRAGGDLKMGLGPNLTLEATVNPDFGQVEADPAEVNLSAFETFFGERRPFFTEGSRLLAGNGPGYFYSRRIGAAPRGRAEGDYVERPNTSTILGAAKITGRLASGTSIGFLSALTAREHAQTFTEASGDAGAAADGFGETEVAPVTGFGVLRVQQEFGANTSTIGLSLAGLERDLSPGEPLAAEMTRRAYSGGADWRLRFLDGDYVVGGSLGASYVAGDSAAIRGVQRSSARYFQRPDADYLDFDPLRRSLSGYAVNLWNEKQGGEHWLWGGGIGAESPGFELNDAGRLGSSDDIDAWSNLTYRETKPSRVLRSYAIEANPVIGWNYGGVRTYSGVEFEFDCSFKNFLNASADVSLFTSAQSDVFTRGGPNMKDPATRTWSAGLASNWAANTRWEIYETFSEDDAGGYGNTVNAVLSAKPNGRTQFSIAPRFSRSRFPIQYFDTVMGGGRPETYGNRYILANLDRSSLSTQLRMNYAFNPDLTLEIYAEPFAASGRYTRHGELAAAGGGRVIEYGRDGGTTLGFDEATGERFAVADGDTIALDARDDFNVLSFRSNFVLRWEWLRGSTLFLVWQQNREASEETGSTVGPRELWDTFSADGENLLALKISYWIPVD